VSGSHGLPHKQSEDVKEIENNLSGHFYRRPSHSGPLVPGSGWPRGVKETDNGPPVSNRVNLAKLSGLVASRTLLSEDQEPKPVPFFHRKPIEVRKSVEATNGSESRRRRDKKRIVDHSQIVNRRVPTEKSTPVSFYLFFLFTNSKCSVVKSFPRMHKVLDPLMLYLKSIFAE
jgi:cyclin-dependent kinase 12/13